MGVVICDRHGRSGIVLVSPDVSQQVDRGECVHALQRVIWADEEGPLSAFLVSPRFAATHALHDETQVIDEESPPEWFDIVGATPTCAACLREVYAGDLDTEFPPVESSED